MEALFHRANELFAERKKNTDLLREVQARLASSASLLEEEQLLQKRFEQISLDSTRLKKESDEVTEKIL